MLWEIGRNVHFLSWKNQWKLVIFCEIYRQEAQKVGWWSFDLDPRTRIAIQSLGSCNRQQVFSSESPRNRERSRLLRLWHVSIMLTTLKVRALIQLPWYQYGTLFGMKKLMMYLRASLQKGSHRFSNLSEVVKHPCKTNFSTSGVIVKRKWSHFSWIYEIYQNILESLWTQNWSNANCNQHPVFLCQIAHPNFFFFLPTVSIVKLLRPITYHFKIK